MTAIDTTTLGDLVAANPATARVFDEFGLDYCCHGERTLIEACEQGGLDPAVVTEKLADLDVKGDNSWTTLDAPELAAHIVETHHRYLHAELPLLEELAAKVLSVHGSRHPELAEVHRLVKLLRTDLQLHMMKEERILFPAINALAAGRMDFAFGSVNNPIRMMSLDHDRAGALIAELRAATRNYAVPEDACASYRSLYERLAEFELDTHLHVHKENHTLFPAAVRLAEA